MGLHRRYEEILCAAGMEKPDRRAGGDVPVDGTGWMTLSVNESDERRLRRAFERMMRRLHEAETGAELRVEFLAEDEPQAFIREHQGILTGALEEVEMSEGMRRRLNSSHYVFSGMKTFHELKEAFPELTRADGSRKSFREFLDDVRKVDETYNGAWLRAEYNFAHRSAQMAARWEASEKNGDRYLLQYRTQSDSKVRPEHAALHGVTLEKGDGFWDYYLPPNGWGCRCTVVEVLRDQYAKTPHDEAMDLGVEATKNDRRNMFRWNSGKKGRTFPDYNPYTIRRCRDCDVNSGKGKLAFVPDNEVCAACRLVRECAANESEKQKRKRIEENRKEYERLSKDKRYKDVEFNPTTGALKATHIGHNEGRDSGFALEKKLVASLYQCGHSIILCDEQKKGRDGNTLVSLDMVLDGVRMDIKSITKNKDFYGSAIREKNKQLVKFNARTDVHEPANTLCLYFDDPIMFAPEKITNGYEYMKGRTSRAIELRHIVCIINSAKGLEIKTFDFQ